MLPVRRNLALFKWNNFFAYMWPMSAIAIIYFERITGSYAMASLIFSIYVLTQSIAELPTGMISDKWSRRKTMLASSIFLILSGIGFALAGNLNSPALLFIGAIAWGIGAAFSSGTDEALMYETCKDLRISNKYDMVFSSAKIWRYLGAAVATIIAVPILYFLNMNVLAWISLIPAFGQLIVSCYFIEPENYKRATVNTLKHFIESLKKFSDNKMLRKITLIQVMNESWGETQYRLSSLYYNLFVPLWAIDIIVFIYRICSSIGFYIAIFLRKIGLLKMAFISTLFKILTIGLGLLFNNIISPFIMSVSSLTTGGEHSAESALLQKEFSDSQRATMRSIVAIFGGIMTAIGFYVFGLLADIYSIYTSLAILLGYKAIISTYYWYLMKKYKD